MKKKTKTIEEPWRKFLTSNCVKEEHEDGQWVYSLIGEPIVIDDKLPPNKAEIYWEFGKRVRDRNRAIEFLFTGKVDRGLALWKPEKEFLKDVIMVAEEFLFISDEYFPKWKTAIYSWPNAYVLRKDINKFFFWQTHNFDCELKDQIFGGYVKVPQMNFVDFIKDELKI